MADLPIDAIKDEASVRLHGRNIACASAESNTTARQGERDASDLRFYDYIDGGVAVKVQQRCSRPLHLSHRTLSM